ncbi:MAG: hypothetical protein A2648_00285 [Candidatus Lloydbacteria bacterium RIFCSPHIGHO2_01_FULL_41_20]|uniref:Uncharacterized protein n=1 Tax=Candidatus Lloydbacteria bacterium RIFCSPHIGHO2_01_FULL_41_20 TaxID=1798657 RepID=A0A1G2CRL7_9BACT|nr:MAG: hypothetical protein A2648_00285 [Candidatus Lloydbacteria bacterium RIFCSPHIGHO2_01_FULL_41_20]
MSAVLKVHAFAHELAFPMCCFKARNQKSMKWKAVSYTEIEKVTCVPCKKKAKEKIRFWEERKEEARKRDEQERGHRQNMNLRSVDIGD